MRKALTAGLLVLVVGAVTAASLTQAALDSVYQLYVAKDYPAAHEMLNRLVASASRAEDRFAFRLELGDFLLDKLQHYADAEAVYEALLADFPKHREVPAVLYRLALAQELQERFLDAAKSYEKVATRYNKSAWGNDALDAIERCFRKNYQDRVAYVDGFPITRIEVDDRISRNPTAYEAFEKKQQLLDTMIDNRLLYTAALAAGISEDTSFRFNMAEQRSRAMFQEWYDREVTTRAEPDEKTLRAQYRKDLASKYTTPEKVHAYQILVANRAEAESLRRLLVSDSSLVWDSLAKTASLAPDKERGGDMGLFARGVQAREIEAAAFSLKVGAISQPIRTKDGWVILKVTERKPKTVRKFDEVRTQLASEGRQQNTSRLYEEKIAELKRRAVIIQDTTALETGKETLAVVNGLVISAATLQQRIDAIPPFFRSQFESPEGRRRILDQLILEKLLMKEAEKGKYWLLNKVVDQLLTRRNQLLIETYRRQMTTEKVQLDSTTLMADYQASLKDFKEPTKVHLREIVARSRERAEQLRRWAKEGRLPAMLAGRALLISDETAVPGFAEAMKSTANIDSLVAQFPLAFPPTVLQGTPTINVMGKNIPDLAVYCRLAGPFTSSGTYGFGFADISKEDRLHRPELITINDLDGLNELLGQTAAAGSDSARLGTYVRLSNPLPQSYVTGLFRLATNDVADPYKTTDGWLLVKVTKKDSAQKVSFADIAKRFSTAGSRWSGGDLYWVARDDKAHDAKVVNAGFSLPKNGLSQVLKLNDSTYAFVLMEERKEAYTRPFSEVKGKIENKLRRAEEKRLNDQLTADLRARAKIEVLMKESDFVVEPLPEETAPNEPKK